MNSYIYSYNVGDLVNVTCYSRGSSPPAELAWKVNDDKVSVEDEEVITNNC